MIIDIIAIFKISIDIIALNILDMWWYKQLFL